MHIPTTHETSKLTVLRTLCAPGKKWVKGFWMEFFIFKISGVSFYWSSVFFDLFWMSFGNRQSTKRVVGFFDIRVGTFFWWKKTRKPPKCFSFNSCLFCKGLVECLLAVCLGTEFQVDVCCLCNPFQWEKQKIRVCNRGTLFFPGKAGHWLLYK